MRHPGWLALLFGSSLVLAGCQSGGEVDAGPATVAKGRKQVATRIAQSWREHIDAGRRKDLDGVMAIYAANAIYAAPGGVELRGRDAIRRHESQTLEDFDVLSAVHETISMNVDGDVAYELGTVEGPVQEKGKLPQEVTWHFMAYWQRGDDGAWRISYLVGRAGISTDDRFF